MAIRRYRRDPRASHLLSCQGISVKPNTSPSEQRFRNGFEVEGSRTPDEGDEV
ncbi:MAG: hypothetical protein PUP92_37180 [Rhizonema sp. PD38]|nr:hypothetical protein [Rhizonema sp. PD38]